MRALAPTAFCSVVTRWPRTRSGQTSIATYALNATNEPRLRSPEITRRPPSHSTASSPSIGRNSSVGMKTASRRAMSSARSTIVLLRFAELGRERLPGAEPFDDADAD